MPSLSNKKKSQADAGLCLKRSRRRIWAKTKNFRRTPAFVWREANVKLEPKKMSGWRRPLSEEKPMSNLNEKNIPADAGFCLKRSWCRIWAKQNLRLTSAFLWREADVKFDQKNLPADTCFYLKRSRSRIWSPKNFSGWHRPWSEEKLVSKLSKQNLRLTPAFVWREADAKFKQQTKSRLLFRQKPASVWFF